MHKCRNIKKFLLNNYLGPDIKNNSNIEFRYSEPKKLQDIEKFFIEFFISIRNNLDHFYDITHELNYLDYSIISTINDILFNNKQNLNGSNNSIENILHKINLKLYENFINLQNGSENILQNDNYDNNNNNNNNHIKNEKNINSGNNEVIVSKINKKNNQISDNNDIIKGKEKNGKENSNFMKINKMNILKELFNTFEVFNKSEIENKHNSKNIDNSEMDGWIFRRELNDKNNPNTDEISAFNFNRFNRNNSNLNNKNEKDFMNNNYNNIYGSNKNDYSFIKKSNNYFNNNPTNTRALDDKFNNVNKVTNYNNYNNNLDNSRTLLKRYPTNGSVKNETIIDMKNRRHGYEMNTIQLSRFEDNNEFIKEENNHGIFETFSEFLRNIYF